jgi:pre-rRNA-processing protein TSR2
MEGSRRLQGQSIGVFSEGIGLVLYRWSALRTAVENEWGGRESRLKADQLAADLLSWFTQSKGSQSPFKRLILKKGVIIFFLSSDFIHCYYYPEPLYIDDLEDILDEGMLSFNVEVEDGSIEEVCILFLILFQISIIPLLII